MMVRVCPEHTAMPYAYLSLCLRLLRKRSMKIENDDVLETVG